MGTTHIEINHRISHPPSVVSEEDELLGTGVQVSPHVSPHYSEREAESQSGSSGLRGGFVDLPYPSELHDPEVHPSDSASRLDINHRPPAEPSRSSSGQREQRPRASTRAPSLHRPRERRRDSPTESIVDSTEDFLARQRYDPVMARPQSYYGYPPSSSSGSYVYPQIGGAPSNQMIQYGPQPMAMAYQPQYPQMASPPPMYPPTHMGYAHPGHHPGSHVSSPYAPSPYPPSMMSYPGPSPGYFPPQYPQAYPHPQYMDSWRVHSPPPAPQQPQQMPMAPPAPPTVSSESEKSKVDPEEITKRIEALMFAERERDSKERADRESAREAALRAAADEAAARAERAASDQRIREEAAASALKAAADAAAAEAERAVREQKIREEAAAAALKAAADEAAAKAQKAASDKKIAEEAAAAAKTEAEKKAAEEAAKIKEESEKKQREAEEKMREAEVAATKAKAEAEAATKKAESLVPTEKRAPIRFHDAVGRKFNFPFELCVKWRGMESLINQAFQHVEVIGEHVQMGHYDLLGPTGEIILPALWESLIEPDWVITMHMWPLPERKEEEMPIPPPPGDLGGILNLDDILNGKSGKGKPKAPSHKNKKAGSAFLWMMGGQPSKSGKKPLKGDKKLT